MGGHNLCRCAYLRPPTDHAGFPPLSSTLDQLCEPQGVTFLRAERWASGVCYAPAISTLITLKPITARYLGTIERGVGECLPPHLHFTPFLRSRPGGMQFIS